MAAKQRPGLQFADCTMSAKFGLLSDAHAAYISRFDSGETQHEVIGSAPLTWSHGSTSKQHICGAPCDTGKNLIIDSDANCCAAPLRTHDELTHHRILPYVDAPALIFAGTTEIVCKISGTGFETRKLRRDLPQQYKPIIDDR